MTAGHEIHGLAPRGVPHFAPLAATPLRKPTKSCRLRPNRSTDHAMTMSKFPSRGVTAQLVERWPLVAALGAADAVVPVNLDDLAAHAAGDLAQFTLLVGRGLVDSGNAQIDNRLSAQKSKGFIVPPLTHRRPSMVGAGQAGRRW
jgi:hypothetical protein